MTSSLIRGGAKLRKQVKKVKIQKTDKYVCFSCKKKSVKRISNSIYECKSCKSKFTGGAYSLNTQPGEVSKRILSKNKKDR